MFLDQQRAWTAFEKAKAVQAKEEVRSKNYELNRAEGFS
jgi:hypothetical protein